MASMPGRDKCKPWQFNKKPFEGAKKSANIKFYNSKAWRSTAKTYKRLNPLCEHCLREGVFTDIMGRRGVVDHIIAIEDNGKKLDPDNLQSLCHRHHLIKSNEDKKK